MELSFECDCADTGCRLCGCSCHDGEHRACARRVEYGLIRYACGVDIPVGTPNAYEAHCGTALF